MNIVQSGRDRHMRRGPRGLPCRALAAVFRTASYFVPRDATSITFFFPSD